MNKRLDEVQIKAHEATSKWMKYASKRTKYKYKTNTYKL